MSPAPPRRDTRYAAGSLLAGRYRIDRLLGEGGFSMVFAAEDTSLGRTVAVKVLVRDAGASEEARKRFEREAQLVSQLSSSHTVRLFDFGETEAGDPFLVLERIQGETLHDRIARGPLRPAEVVEIVRQVLESLREAHDAGIIHRDLKPSNIMLFENYDAIQTKVLDFGVAGLLAGAPHRASAAPGTLTGHGAVLGTRGYMSPEQALGQKLTAAADMFALGVVALEAMTGRNPLLQQGHSPLKLHLTRERLRIPEEVDLAPPIREVFDRMLAADVSKRFRDGGEAFDALQNAAAESSAVAAVDIVGSEAHEPVGAEPAADKDASVRRRAGFVPAIAVAAILAGVAVVAIAVSGPEPNARSTAPPGTAGSLRPVARSSPVVVDPEEHRPEPAQQESDDAPRFSTALHAHQNIAIAVEVARLRAADRADNLERERRPAKRPSSARRSAPPSKPVPKFDVQLVGEESK